MVHHERHLSVEERQYNTAAARGMRCRCMRRILCAPAAVIAAPCRAREDRRSLSMRNIEGGATHARTTNKQTNREPRRRRQLPTYRRLLATTLVVRMHWHALASGTLSLTGDSYLQRLIRGTAPSVRRLTLGHKGGCASARIKASPQVLGGSRQRVVESDRALDVITPTRERPRTLVRTYTCMHACMHACIHAFICMNAWM